MLSALAGGGLTAALLGGPLASTVAADGSSWSAVVTSEGTTTSTSGSVSAPAVEAVKESTWESASTSSTTSTRTTAAKLTSAEAPTVVLQRKQKPTAAEGATGTTGATGKVIGLTTAAETAAQGNVAEAPQVVAAQLGGLEEELAGSAVSAQALSFYRIPLFLLPIYQAAAVQYGVPWEVLAAINEIETDYGNDLSVSTAGAVGWMQFMPSTWLQYGVDALDTGYADPYNPVDAVFAAARYLKAAGAAKNLSAAILSYNHSSEYVQSVLLRAKLISDYPGEVIATLTGLSDGRLPVRGSSVHWSEPPAPVVSTAPPGASAAALPPARSSATAKATALAPATVGSAVVKGAASAPQFADVMSAAGAPVVAVQDGRIAGLGASRKLGRYLILKDVYGDVFTYAGLGSVAKTYVRPKAPRTATATPAAGAGGSTGATGATGTAGPLTVRAESTSTTTSAGSETGGTGAGNEAAQGLGDVTVADEASVFDSAAAGAAELREVTPVGTTKLFSLAAILSAAPKARRSSTSGRLPLRVGALVSQGTVLGHMLVPPGATDGHLRFSVRPAGDPSTIDPSTVLANWQQLGTALHPQGAAADTELVGATASGVFLQSAASLERTVLADPGIAMSACARHEVASGKIDRRLLAVLAFLSRSGLEPAVGTLACGNGAYAQAGYVSSSHLGDAVAITQINGVPIAGNQGAGSITDTAIRALLTLAGEYVPHDIVSLMQYPGAPNTHARKDHGSYIEIAFLPRASHAVSARAVASAAHSAGAKAATAPSPLTVGGSLSAAQWNQLITRIGTLPKPKVKTKPSKSAISDK